MASAPGITPEPPVYSPSPQLHLPLERRREPTLDEFLPGPNAEALAAITATSEGHGEPFLFLWGGPGTGKTHLLQGACLQAAATGQRVYYAPLATVGLTPELFDSLEQSDLIAIDDLHSIAGIAAWEQALFNLFNRLRECGHRLITAANTAPEALALQLEDLRSRLQWGPCYHLLTLTDADSARLLEKNARVRGLTLNADLVRYIMNNHSRDPGSLLALIARIDAASLREQRQPSIPMIRRLLQEEP